MSKIAAIAKGTKPNRQPLPCQAWTRAPREDLQTGREQPTGGKRRRRQSWVEIYARKGELSETQLLAAEPLARAAEGYPDWDTLAAVLSPKGADGFDPQAARVEAGEEFRRMWADVPGAGKPELQRVVLKDQAIWSGGGAAA